MKPLYFYLKSSVPSFRELAEIKRAGYVPVGVNCFEDIKVVIPIPDLLADPISKAALETLRDSHVEKEAFATRLLRAVTEAEVKTKSLIEKLQEHKKL